MPLQIDAPDVTFTRLNTLNSWLFFFGGLIAIGGFLTGEGAASFGRTAHTPFQRDPFPREGRDMWMAGIVLSGLLNTGQNQLTWMYWPPRTASKPHL
jgi:cytochrome c oxidase subunit 1